MSFNNSDSPFEVKPIDFKVEFTKGHNEIKKTGAFLLLELNTYIYLNIILIGPKFEIKLKTYY